MQNRAVFLTLMIFLNAPGAARGQQLPDGKKLTDAHSVTINSMPTAMVLSRDGRYAITLNNGYGTQESGMRQSLSVLELSSDTVTDFPDARLGQNAKQSYFLGLALSDDGKHIYASMSSETDPEGTSKPKKGEEPPTGNGIAVYSFSDGKVAPERFIKIAMPSLPEGKTAARITGKMPAGKLIPYPAGITVVGGAEHEQLLVAENLADDAMLLDAVTGDVIHRFDLSAHKVIPAEYPQSVAVTRDGKTGYVSLWNGSAVAVLDLRNGAVKRKIALSPAKMPAGSGSHPTALLLSPDEKRLYVALANRDEVALINTKTFEVYVNSTKLPGEERLGAYPSALAQTPDGKILFVANAGTNSIYCLGQPMGSSGKTKGVTRSRMAPLSLWFVPTEWYPQALVVQDGRLVIASGKGRGTGPNDVLKQGEKSRKKTFPYIFSLLHGSLTQVDIKEAYAKREHLTAEAVRNNKIGAGGQPVFAGKASPIKHVIYVIKENRSYDQVFGDIPGANGDPSLVMFGADITPNQHKLALEFGVLDNFYDSGEVSGDGHNWSTSATGGDYLEKTIPIAYRGLERTYDFEGEVGNRVPLDDDIADVNETGTGYIWSNVARHGLTYRHYGEYILTGWCNEKKADTSPKEGTPIGEGAPCEKTWISKGERLPAQLGYGANDLSPYPWKIPQVAKNTPTKPELRKHFDAMYPDFNLEYPDQLRADEFLREFRGFVEGRNKGAAQALPNYVLLRLGNDHTSGTKAGVATPAAAIADNDLALGRVVDAVSHSPYWDDTAILVLEDDAQDGPDHVDAHRSIALVISKYSPSSAAKPFVDSQFYSTVNMAKTLESLLGLPPMNANDANAPAIASLFRGNGDHAPFTADFRNRDNGLLYQANPAKGPGAKESAEMDFTHADRADTAKLNAILWQNRMGDKPMPNTRKRF